MKRLLGAVGGLALAVWMVLAAARRADETLDEGDV